MSNYVRVRVNVSEAQVSKIKKAVSNGESVSIRLTHCDLIGEHVLHVTKAQSDAIMKHRQRNTGMVLKLSKAAVRHNVKSGGFLSAILPLLATVGRTLLSSVVPGLLGGLLGGGGSQNEASGSGLLGSRNEFGGSMKVPKVFYVKKGMSGIKITKVGSGVYLSPWKGSNEVSGNGVFMKPYKGGGYIDGSGLISGTPQGQGPLDKVPILGSLLGWLI